MEGLLGLKRYSSLNAPQHHSKAGCIIANTRQLCLALPCLARRLPPTARLAVCAQLHLRMQLPRPAGRRRASPPARMFFVSSPRLADATRTQALALGTKPP
jgi:hypothetical protein